MLIAGGVESLLPRFEIIPDGAQTKRMAMLRWANREAAGSVGVFDWLSPEAS